MGLSADSVRFLLAAAHAGVDFSTPVTFGRQGLRIPPEALVEAFRLQDRPLDLEEARAILADRYAEPLLSRLGATRVDAVDGSGYEGATLIHDMNTPLPAAMQDRCSVFVDGGSLEHVFNVPVALENCMKMVAPGGHLILLTPANNYMGHGFYQFSPELFFRALAPENGYRVRALIYKEPAGRWYAVSDPAALRRRPWLVSARRALLYVLARREGPAGIFATPMQSDYAEMLWKGEEHPAPQGGNGGGLRSHVPEPVRRLAGEARRRVQRLDPQSFRPVELGAPGWAG